jgi:hypothetical protein
MDRLRSDPPHPQGYPLNVRELQVYTDKPEFTLNPTNCERLQVRATLFGTGTVLAPTADTPPRRLIVLDRAWEGGQLSTGRRGSVFNRT